MKNFFLTQKNIFAHKLFCNFVFETQYTVQWEEKVLFEGSTFKPEKFVIFLTISFKRIIIFADNQRGVVLLILHFAGLTKKFS